MVESGWNTKNLGFFFLSTVILLIALYFTTLYSYLLFHSIIELFAIIIACVVFVIGWNALDDSGYFRFIGIAYLFVGIIDILHTLSYSGMGVFPGFDANLPTQLWILARYTESFSLFIGPFIMDKTINKINLMIVFGIITALLSSTVFMGIFPVCFVVGIGLTPFKILSEYVIVVILMSALYAYRIKTHRFDKSVLSFLYASIIFTIAAELSFTLYVDPYGFANMVGHYFRFVSYFFIYKAIIESSLVRPYDVIFRELNARKEELSAINDLLELTNKMIVHDIRNELSVVKLSIQLYQESNNADYLDQISKSVESCSDLIDNAQELVQDGDKSSELFFMNIRDIILHAIEGSKLRVSIEGDGFVFADANLFSIFKNIILNVESHSSSDSLDISIQKRGEMNEIRFSDQGVGIPTELREKVFYEGVRGDSSKGLGLGLYIAKRLVTRYNGMISIEPNSPRGTTFIVSIPAAKG